MSILPIFDIGANLTDGMFRGIYHSKPCHKADIFQVLRRAKAAGVHKILITSSTLNDTVEAIKLIKEVESSDYLEFGGMMKTTVGVHPTHAGDFENDSKGAVFHLSKLATLLKQHREYVYAVGECGLDYDRLNFSCVTAQLSAFQLQFALAEQSGLPMFLHLRNAQRDFIDVIKKNRQRFSQGVVHSFTGTIEEVDELIALGLYIGVNGCSLKTEANLETVKHIPIGRMMIESDAPWCEIRPTHAAYAFIAAKNIAIAKEKYDGALEKMVKSRNEPCNTRQVLEAIAKVKGIEIGTTASTIYANSCKVFGWSTLTSQ